MSVYCRFYPFFQRLKLHIFPYWIYRRIRTFWCVTNDWICSIDACQNILSNNSLCNIKPSQQSYSLSRFETWKCNGRGWWVFKNYWYGHLQKSKIDCFKQDLYYHWHTQLYGTWNLIRKRLQFFCWFMEFRGYDLLIFRRISSIWRKLLRSLLNISTNFR